MAYSNTNLYSSPCSSSGSSSSFGSNSDEITLASNRPKRRAGRKVFNETRHPVYRGIRRRNNNKWVCEVREPKKQSRIWLGTYPTAEMAARAHDVAALALRGRKACLNFADSVWRLPIPTSADAEDIRKAAVKAAEEFRPKEISTRSLECGETLIRDVDQPLVMYDDEEAIFELPWLLSSMAEGLLLSPPHYTETGFIWDKQDDAEVSLWNFSI